MARHGNENAASDAGTAAWLARAGVEGAVLNVAINLPEVPEEERESLRDRARTASGRAAELLSVCTEEVGRRVGAEAAPA